MLNITTGTLSKIFKLIKDAINEIKNNNVGFYASESALKSAYSSPTKGMMGYVLSSGTTYTIYRCTTAGTWTKTSETYTLSTDILSDLDYTPKSNSEKLVTSGGVYDADVSAKKQATSILPFAGFIDISSASVSPMSVAVSDNGSNVYYNYGDDAFYLKSGTKYVNNWLNRDDWADSSNHGYTHKQYLDTSTGAIYRWFNKELQMIIPPFTTITQAAYDALTTKDEDVYYLITEE